MQAVIEALVECQARQKRFADWYPDGNWPAQTLAVVAALGMPELVVEVEAVATAPG
ncbi:hypothetical protein ACIP79_02960 [Streptomyces sp. NPDC088747]|uniref:hypothetical protein n=1 Tax=Streptomyces sp. NPDC088747 TaxID=3365886 RepID=UPI00382A4FA4